MRRALWLKEKLRVSEQKVNALKQVACDYIRNNPNRVDYIRVRF